jgi:tetratricopeptide (TPR) repeat protein
VSWSWELLDAVEQSGLRQCAVFRGGFGLEAAEAVLAEPGRGVEVLEVLHSLCDKSMIRAEARFGDPTRFELYYGVREFAAEELLRSGVEPEVRGRHAAYYVNAGAEWASEVERTGQSGERLSLIRERDNLLAAYENLWNEGACAAEELPRALQAILALEPVFATHGPIDQLARLLDAFFRHPGAAAVAVVLRARALRVRSKALQLTGMLDAAERDIEDACALLSKEGDEWTLACVVADSGVLHHQRRHLEVARRRYEHALLLYEKLGSKRQEARLLGNVGALHHDLRDFEMAEAYYVRALERLRRLSEPGFEGNVLANLGVLAQEQERHDQSAEYFERAERVLQRAGDRRLLGIAQGNWGALEHERGRPEAALSLLSSALRELEDFGDSASVALCLARIGAVKATLEAPEASKADLERARRLFSSEEDPLLATAIDLYDAFRKVRSEAPASGDTIRAARSRMQRARQPLRDGGPSAEDLSDDVRSALRLIEREVSRTEPLAPFLDGAPADALVIGEGAAWFCAPRGVSQRLSHNGAVRRILLALVQAREVDPTQGLGLNELRDAGWPGERMTAEAAANRVHVALAELRRKGLKGSLERSASGAYSLGAGVRVHRVARDATGK